MQRILLADSDRATRQLLSPLLHDYQILYAPTGAGALTLALQKRPRLAIVECALRDMSGVELLLKLRQVVLGIAVVMISPYDTDWIRESAQSAGARAYLTKPLEMQILRCVVQQALPVGFLDATRARELASANQKIIQRAKSFIETHYAEELSVAELCSQLHISRFALYRKFKTVEGVSFRQYLLHVRLRKAIALLATGRHSIAEVAQIVGFGDLPRFDKLFKRATGCTPSAYRKLKLAGAENA